MQLVAQSCQVGDRYLNQLLVEHRFGLGAGAFKWVGLKPDLGALLVGILLARHPKAGELSDVLLGFKDLLLIGFFLSIGLTGLPSMADLGIASLLVLGDKEENVFRFQSYQEPPEFIANLKTGLTRNNSRGCAKH